MSVWTTGVLPRTTSLLTLLLALLLSTSAGAASVVALPQGESEALWVELLATAELWAGGGDGSVSIDEHETGWTLVTRDPSGREHRVELTPPTTDEARMEVAMLAVSLLQPPRVRVATRRAIRTPPPVEEPAAALEVPTEPVAPPAQQEPQIRPERPSFPSTLGAFVAATGALEIHETRVAGGTVAVETGVGMPAGLRLAARVVLDGDFGAPVVSTAPSSSLPPIHLSVGGSVSWSADLPVSPLVGIGGGARWNVARSPDTLLRRRVVTPQLDVMLGVSVNPPGWFRFEPLALLRVGANVDMLQGPALSSVALDVSVLAGLKVSVLTPAKHPVHIDRRGR